MDQAGTLNLPRGAIEARFVAMRALSAQLAFAAAMVACGGDRELALLPGSGGAAATGGAGGGTGACASSQQCLGEEQFCNPQRARCVRCLVSQHCEPGKACAPDGECRQSCAAGCSSGSEHCDPATGACVQCRDHFDCISSSKPRCVLGECGQCASDADCTSGNKLHCLDSECVECLADGHCKEGQSCDPSEHECKG